MRVEHLGENRGDYLMTWVVGGKHLFCARCISDVQVTVPLTDGSKRYFDAVQKVHVLGPGLAIAFAGSIRLAFEIIEELKATFSRTMDPRLRARPDEIMVRMQRWIRHYYSKFSRRDEYVEFLVLAAPSGLPSGLFTSFGVWKVCAPKFNIIEPETAFQMLQLGSGANAEEFREAVKRHSVGVYEMDQGPGERPAAVIPVGKVALRYLFEEALDYRTAGVSQAMHITMVTHDSVVTQGLPEDPNGTFPRVASSWAELKKIVREKGIDLGKGSAMA